MKPKTVPTSPKGRSQSETVGRLYNDNSMSKLQRPLRVRLGVTFGVIIIILAVVAGLFGAVIFDWLVYQTPHWGLWQRLNLAVPEKSMTAVTFTSQAPTSQDWNNAYLKARSSLVSLFIERSGEGLWDQVYRSEDSLGTAVILSADGLLITLDDIIPVADDQTVVAVTPDGNIYPITLTFDDPASQYSFAMIEAKDLKAAAFVTADQIAITQPLLRLQPNLLGHDSTELISVRQTNYFSDILIATESLAKRILVTMPNASRASDVVITKQGDIVGLASADGVVPMYNVSTVLKTALADQVVERAFLGLKTVDVQLVGLTAEQRQAQDSGARVTAGQDNSSAVADNSPASEAGLQAGDVIIAIDDITIESAGQLAEVIQSFTIGETITIIYVRDGQSIETRATLTRAT